MGSIKEWLRTILRPLLERESIKKSLIKRLLYKNFKEDANLFEKYAALFNKEGIKNKEANLILHYHSLEKGMLFKKMNKGFGAYRVKNLHILLSDPEIEANISRSQIKVAYQVMCQYYELHIKLDYNIQELFSSTQYDRYKAVLSKEYSTEFSGTINWSSNKFYEDVSGNFEQFAHSRKSVRDFTGELIPLPLLKSAIELANTSPSVCNRQASKVYLITNKQKIDQILKIQGGFTGYSDNVSQLLILTNDRRYYYTVGERHQLYIDGGIYLLNLLYALHYHKIGNCPANWGKTIKEEAPINHVINIPESEKIICIIPIGIVKSEFRTTLSLRRPEEENFVIIDE